MLQEQLIAMNSQYRAPSAYPSPMDDSSAQQRLPGAVSLKTDVTSQDPTSSSDAPDNSSSTEAGCCKNSITTKRTNNIGWDDYFMSIAFLSAMRSKDPSTQVGACIVSPDKRIVGIGYNGFPSGCSDDDLPWARVADDALDTKYPVSLLYWVFIYLIILHYLRCADILTLPCRVVSCRTVSCGLDWA